MHASLLVQDIELFEKNNGQLDLLGFQQQMREQQPRPM